MQVVDLQTQKIFEQEDDAPVSSTIVPLDETIEMWNYDKNGTERVHADDVPAKLSVDSHSFVSGSKVPVYKGDLSTVEEYDPIEAQNMVQFDGASVARPKDAREVFLQRKYGTPGQQAIAGAEQLASGATFGASEVAEKMIGVPVEDIEGRKEANPWTAGAANVAGTITGPAGKALTAIGKGIGFGVQQAAKPFLRKGIETVGKNATKSLVGATKYGLSGAAEGAALGAADYTKNAILHDEDFSTDAMVAHAKPAALISGMIGGTVGAAAPHLAKKMRGWANSSRKTIQDARRAAGLATDEVEADIALNTLQKERSPYDKTKRGVSFKKDPANEGLYVYDDGDKKVVLDIKKIPGDIINHNNPEAVREYVGILTNDPTLTNLTDPTRLKTTFGQEVYDAFKIRSPVDQAAIDYLSQNRRTRYLADALAERASFSQMAEAGPLDDAAIKKARSADQRVQLFLKRWKPNPKVKEPFLNSMVRRIKDGESAHIAQGKAFRSSLDNIGAFVEGENLIFTNQKAIPKEAVVQGFKKIGTERAPIKKDLNSILKAFGAGKSQLDKFAKAFSPDEREFVSKYIVDKLEQTGKYRLGPNLERLHEVLQSDRQAAIEQMENAVTRMDNALDARYGNSAVARTGLTGSSLRDHIKREFIPSLMDKVMDRPLAGNSQAVEKLVDYADELYKTRLMPDGRELPYTLQEWRELRKQIDGKIKNFIEVDKLPIQQDALLDLRHWMEEKVVNKAFDLVGPGMVQDRADYLNGKMIYRITNGKKGSPSLFNIIEQGISKDAAKHGLRASDLGLGGLGGLTGAAAFGGPGAVLGTAAGMGSRALTDNADYMMYQYYKNLAPKVERTFRAANRGALEFSNLYGKRVAIGAQQLYISQQDIDYLEKNREKIEASLNAPEAYFDNANASARELNVIREGLGAKLAEKGHNALSFIYGKMPKSPYPKHADLKWEPTAIQSLQFKRYVNATLYPETIFKHFGEGYISAEEIEVLKTVYPGMYQRFKELVGQKIQGKALGMDQKALLKRVFGAESAYSPPTQLQLKAQAQQEIQQDKIRKSSREMSGQQKTENERIQDK